MTEYNTSFKREILSEKPFLLCPSCFSKCASFPHNLLEFYKAECKICNTPIGFIHGNVKARKLGSYIRLIDGKEKQISIDISSFGDNFDVRKDDEVLLVYQLNYFQKRPVMLINRTINEIYFMFAYKFQLYKASSTREPISLLDYKERFKNTARYLKDYFGEKEFPMLTFIDVDKKVDLKWYVNKNKLFI